MAERQETSKAPPHPRWEFAYRLIAVLFGILMVLALAYALWAAFQYADSAEAENLARMVTSGFLFLFSGVAMVGMWLRLIILDDNRWLISQLRPASDASGK